jgi:hypothetical protein
MATRAASTACLKPLCIRITPEVDELLRAMALPRGLGMFLSQLVWKEAALRSQQPALLEALRAMRETQAQEATPSVTHRGREEPCSSPPPPNRT